MICSSDIIFIGPSDKHAPTPVPGKIYTQVIWGWATPSSSSSWGVRTLSKQAEISLISFLHHLCFIRFSYNYTNNKSIVHCPVWDETMHHSLEIDLVILSAKYNLWSVILLNILMKVFRLEEKQKFLKLISITPL